VGFPPWNNSWNRKTLNREPQESYIKTRLREKSKRGIRKAMGKESYPFFKMPDPNYCPQSYSFRTKPYMPPQ